MYLSGVLRCTGVVLSLNPFSGPLPAQPVDLPAHLERRIPEWLERYDVPGVSVALVHDARLVWSRGFGLADVTAGTPMSDSTLCHTGSISKSLALWGVYHLVEQGRIELDRPVEVYMEGYRDHNQTTFQLLAECIEANEKERKVSFALLEKLIENISGEEFPAYMRREILLPLGMSDSHFNAGPKVSGRTATGHNAFLQPIEGRSVEDDTGLTSTVKDIARFVAASLPSLEAAVHGYPALNLSTIQLMQQPVADLKGWGRYRASWYGMGYNLETTANGFTVFSSYQDQDPGWRNQFYGVPETGDGLVVLTNGENGLALINAIAGAWSAEANLGALRLVRTITGIQRVVMGFTAGVAFITFLMLLFFIYTLRKQGRRLPRRSSWRAVTATLISLGGFWALIWIVSRQLLSVWLPCLAPWPLTAVNAFCGVSLLTTLFPKADPSPVGLKAEPEEKEEGVQEDDPEEEE